MKVYAGINYSGMHDSAVAVVKDDGEVLFAKSLERVTRVKHDGRPPSELISLLDQFSVESVSTSTLQYPEAKDFKKSLTFQSQISRSENTVFSHSKEFGEFFSSLNLPVRFVEHQKSHAMSAIFWSGFEEGNCFTYDGGMCNSSSFGSIFNFKDRQEIRLMDEFDFRLHPKITTLYSLVTALLGFQPNRHEGKITGLAALGNIQKPVWSILEDWFENRFLEIEPFATWELSYSNLYSPRLQVNFPLIENLKNELGNTKTADIAATLQAFTEHHVISILSKALELDLMDIRKPICLAGGLFSNVRLNYKIFEMGFPDVFVSPAMTDDGTALGSAWVLASENGRLSAKTSHAFLGASVTSKTGKTHEIDELGLVQMSPVENLPEFIAQRLHKGEIIAVYQENAEFGPRALGNRSILASATDASINLKLNSKLNRTEFMPFAPIILSEDYEDLFETRRNSSLPYMTITSQVKASEALNYEAIVHKDGSARPQTVTMSSNPLIYNILVSYQKLSARKMLINTSFNVHEEPIVDSVSDAVFNFLISGIDLLVIGEKIYSYADNILAASEILRKALFQKGSNFDKELIYQYQIRNNLNHSSLVEKEKVIQELARENSALRELMNAAERKTVLNQ